MTIQNLVKITGVLRAFAMTPLLVRHCKRGEVIQASLGLLGR